jgi:hypothetical protein
VIPIEIALADVAASPPYSTDRLLDQTHGRLEFFKKHCGRYPFASEGLKVFYAKKTDLPKSCRNYPDFGGDTLYDLDGWGQKLRYTSDGRTYRIEASHGYSLTENSAMHEKKQHWDNPNPPIGAENPTEGMFSEEDVE